MAKSRPVKSYRPMRPCRLIEHSADEHILDHRAIAVQENHGRPGAPLDVVQSHTVRGHNAPSGGWSRSVLAERRLTMTAAPARASAPTASNPPPLACVDVEGK